MARDPKITPITRHDPRTFYATRVTRTQAGEAWDLWSVEDGRRVGFLTDAFAIDALPLMVLRALADAAVLPLAEGEIRFMPTARLAGIDEFLSSSWGVPVEIARPLERVGQEAGQFSAEELEQAGPLLAVGVGLGLRRAGDKNA